MRASRLALLAPQHEGSGWKQRPASREEGAALLQRGDIGAPAAEMADVERVRGGGGLAEELTRCFSLQFFEDSFGKRGLYFAYLMSSVIFGLGHLYQGTVGVLTLFGAGLLWGWLYIRQRSLVTNILTHGLFDLAGSLIACYLARG